MMDIEEQITLLLYRDMEPLRPTHAYQWAQDTARAILAIEILPGITVRDLIDQGRGNNGQTTDR